MKLTPREEQIRRGIESCCPGVDIEMSHDGIKWIIVGRQNGVAVLKASESSLVHTRDRFQLGYTTAIQAGLVKGPVKKAAAR